MKKYSILFIIIIFISSVSATQIKVYNKTKQKLYLAFYYVSIRGKATKAGKQRVIIPPYSITMKRPKVKIGYSIHIAYSFGNKRLQGKFSKKKFKHIKHRPMGIFHGHLLYVIQGKKGLRGYTHVEWKARSAARKVKKTVKKTAKKVKKTVKKTAKKVKKTVKKTAKKVKKVVTNVEKKIRNTFPQVRNNPYKKKVARVRISRNISHAEKIYLQKRIPFARRSLERFIGRKLPGRYTPKIAFMGSGGGYRAMLSTTGFLVGAKKIGLLDSSLYVAGVSGSTWAIGSWMSSNKDIRIIKQHLIRYAGTDIKKLSLKEEQLLIQRILLKYAYQQPITTVDFYGGFLANNLLRHRGMAKQNITLSHQARLLASGKRIFPIYTAVRGDSEKSEQCWYEFNPYEIGSLWLGVYVPSWAYGRRFIRGKSIDFAPEQSFGYLLGTYGSAYASTLNRVYREFGNKVPPFARPAIKTILKGIGKARIDAARIRNFYHYINRSHFAKRRNMKLIDAGFHINLPYPPLSGVVRGRKPDILIFLDASTSSSAGSLKKSEAYARKRRLPFPVIDYTKAGKQVVSIFHGTHKNIPTVIYFPLGSDLRLWNSVRHRNEYKNFRRYLDRFNVRKAKYTGTFNFKYSNFQANQITAVTEFNMRISKAKIIWAIVRKILQNR